MKRLFLVICLIVFAFNSKAGDKKGFGIKAGLNLDQFKAQGFEKNLKTNPTAGIFMYINSKRYGLQLEALYSTNQVTTSSSFYNLYKNYQVQFLDSINSGSFKFTNISIPILLNYKLGSRAWLQFGPQYTASINVVDKNNLLATGQNIFKSNDLSGVVGLNLRLALKLGLSARYVFGLNNVNDIKQATEAWSNKSAQIHLSYKLF